MANSEKNMAQVDAEQALRFAFDNGTKTFAVDSFLSLKVGHKISRVVVSPTVDDISYYDGANLLQTLRITYTNAAHDDFVSAERTA
jgi:hypothetical protein